jgi:hypothetical protein
MGINITSGREAPDLAVNPATTAHTASAEPAEISIMPAMMTIVIPQAAMTSGAALMRMSRRLSVCKKPGVVPK